MWMQAYECIIEELAEEKNIDWEEAETLLQKMITSGNRIVDEYYGSRISDLYDWYNGN